MDSCLLPCDVPAMLLRLTRVIVTCRHEQSGHNNLHNEGRDAGRLLRIVRGKCRL